MKQYELSSTTDFERLVFFLGIDFSKDMLISSGSS